MTYTRLSNLNHCSPYPSHTSRRLPAARHETRAERRRPQACALRSPGPSARARTHDSNTAQAHHVTPKPPHMGRSTTSSDPHAALLPTNESPLTLQYLCPRHDKTHTRPRGLDTKPECPTWRGQIAAPALPDAKPRPPRHCLRARVRVCAVGSSPVACGRLLRHHGGRAPRG